MAHTRLRPIVLASAMLLGACGSDTAPAEQLTETTTTTVSSSTTADDTTTSTSDQTTAATDAFPAVIGATATPDGDGTWRFDVTLSSPYDTPERYADAWRILGPDGTEYGIRVLAHDHANEQPFTRSQSGIPVPADVTTVTVQGRDLANGWGGPTFELTLPEAGE